MEQTNKTKCDLAKKILLITEHYGEQNKYASKLMEKQQLNSTQEVAQMFFGNTNTLCEELATQVITRHALYEYETALNKYQPKQSESQACNLLKHSMRNLQFTYGLKIEPPTYNQLAQKLLALTKSLVTAQVSDATSLLKVYSISSIIPLNQLEKDYLQSLNNAITKPLEQNIRTLAKPHVKQSNQVLPLGNGDYELHL